MEASQCALRRRWMNGVRRFALVQSAGSPLANRALTSGGRRSAPAGVPAGGAGLRGSDRAADEKDRPLFSTCSVVGAHAAYVCSRQEAECMMKLWNARRD